MEQNIVNVAETKQPTIFKQFMNLVKRNELSHAYLFTGEDGAGQFSVAMGVAMRLFLYECSKWHAVWSMSRVPTNHEL